MLCHMQSVNNLNMTAFEDPLDRPHLPVRVAI